MKGCLLIVLGAFLGVVALFLFLTLSPASVKRSNGRTTGSPDMKVTLYEPYINRLAVESLNQNLAGKVSAIAVDVRPGSKVIVSMKVDISSADTGTGLLGAVASVLGKVKKGAVDLQVLLKASISGGKLRFRVEEIKIGNLPVQRKLLVGPLGAMVSSVEQRMNGEINARLQETHLTPIGVESDDGSLTVYLKGG